MQLTKRRLIVIGLALALAWLPLPAQQVYGQTEERCFTETGFCISGRIREFWERNGGLAVFGLPLDAQHEEQIEGKPFQVQWFERNRLELHPENAHPYDVLIGRLGADRLIQQGRDWFSFPKSELKPGCRFFAETGHNVCGAILNAWRAQGLDLDGRRSVSEAESLGLFGMPLSDEQTETIEGKQYTVQWFERARFELHPENQPPYDVLLGRLGAEIRTAPAPTPAPSEQIVFQSYRDKNYDIYVMNIDGSNVRRLTDHAAQDQEPRWSPDGSRIVFVSNRDGNDEIYVMNADGSNQTRLTTNTIPDGGPDWSPDGRRIVYTSYTNGIRDLYVMNADGSGITQLTSTPRIEAAPDWSPDGKYIAYTLGGDNNDWDISIMNADGSNSGDLVALPTRDGMPRWSPDGGRIAFWSMRDGNTEVYVMNTDGSNQMRLTNNPGVDTQASWSKDGSRIVFYTIRDGNGEIYVMNADGSGQTNLTNTPAHDSNPDWSH